MSRSDHKFRSLLKRLPFKRFRNPPPVVAVVRLSGVIGGGGMMRGGLTLSDLEPVLEKAFGLYGLACVALAVNSPGGSPVQSSLIAGRIRALAAEKQVRVIAFAEDLAASGGYWLACAGDEIWADESSIVGSIGVIHAGFGFPELLERFGVERRLHASGKRKGMLDPFSPENKEDVRHLKKVQEDIHETFREWVRGRRSERLKADEAELFSGAWWSGRQALEKGLIDGLGNLHGLMRERHGEDVKLVPVQAARPWWRRFAPGRGEAWAAGALSAAEERLMWSRFGL